MGLRSRDSTMPDYHDGVLPDESEALDNMLETIRQRDREAGLILNDTFDKLRRMVFRDEDVWPIEQRYFFAGNVFDKFNKLREIYHEFASLADQTEDGDERKEFFIVFMRRLTNRRIIAWVELIVANPTEAEFAINVPADMWE